MPADRSFSDTVVMLTPGLTRHGDTFNELCQPRVQCHTHLSGLQKQRSQEQSGFVGQFATRQLWSLFPGCTMGMALSKAVAEGLVSEWTYGPQQSCSQQPVV